MTIKDFSTLNLPDVPGVYSFVDSKDRVIYVGKATSLRDRVRSYFDQDLIETRGRRIVEMVVMAKTVNFEITPSVLEALILEADTIKKLTPYYNVKDKDNKSFNFVVITKEKFPKIITLRERTFNANFPKKQVLKLFGPFPNGNVLKEVLRFVRKLFPYRDEKCLPAIEQRDPKNPKPCFNYHLGLCPGACAGVLSPLEYSKTIRHITLLFEGKKTKLIRELEDEMSDCAKRLEFEKASKIKKTIFSLEHINDLALIKADQKLKNLNININIDTNTETADVDTSTGNGQINTRLNQQDINQQDIRIEGYDASHTQGAGYVGVMVVYENDEINKKAYRTFSIKTTKKSNDTGALKEIIRRRLNHPEWGWPDIIVTDGGIAQRNAGVEACADLPEDKKPCIIGVVKNKKHQPKGFVYVDNLTNKSLPVERLVELYSKEILLVNSEAHRFAVHFHRRVRAKVLNIKR